MATEKKSEYLKIPDAISGITGALKKSNGRVSINRTESVESHLRAVLRLLGYRPTETSEQKASIAQLADQVDACLKAEEGKLSESAEEHIQLYLHATHSNLAADISSPGAMPLKEVPGTVRKPSTPSGPKEELSAKTVDELKKIAVEYGAEIATDAKKADIVSAILKKAGYAE